MTQLNRESEFCISSGMPITPTSAALEKFKRQPLRMTESGCAEWTGRSINGYGVLYSEDRIFYVRRLAAFLKLGAFTPAKIELKCGNRLCCHPAHMREDPIPAEHHVRFDALFPSK